MKTPKTAVQGCMPKPTSYNVKCRISSPKLCVPAAVPHIGSLLHWTQLEGAVPGSILSTGIEAAPTTAPGQYFGPHERR
jgi:hypothetical protein